MWRIYFNMELYDCELTYKLWRIRFHGLTGDLSLVLSLTKTLKISYSQFSNPRKV